MEGLEKCSVHSKPSHCPPGLRCFNIRALLKDEVLHERFLNRDSSVIASLDAAAAAMEPVPDLDSAIGALLKRVDPQEKMVVVDNYHISCASEWGPLDNTAEYAGMVLYSLDGKTDWKLNYRHCQSGYIYFRKIKNISKYRSNTGQVHGQLYVSLFNEEPGPGLVASGFAIRHGVWRFNSGTFNRWQAPGSRTMSPSEQTLVKEAVLKFAISGQKIHPVAKHSISSSRLNRGTSTCRVCAAPAGLACMKCLATRYCSEACRKEDWEPRHRYECGLLSMLDMVKQGRLSWATWLGQVSSGASESGSDNSGMGCATLNAGSCSNRGTDTVRQTKSPWWLVALSGLVAFSAYAGVGALLWWCFLR